MGLRGLRIELGLRWIAFGSSIALDDLGVLPRGWPRATCSSHRNRDRMNLLRSRCLWLRAGFGVATRMSTPSSSHGADGCSCRSTTADALATVLERLLTRREPRESIRARGREHGRSMVWTNVAGGYAELFQAVVCGCPLGRSPRARANAPGHGRRRALVSDAAQSFPSRGDTPTSCTARSGYSSSREVRRARRSHGYCTDDVAALSAWTSATPSFSRAIVAGRFAADVAFIREAYEPGYGGSATFDRPTVRWLDGSVPDAHGAPPGLRNCRAVRRPGGRQGGAPPPARRPAGHPLVCLGAAACHAILVRRGPRRGARSCNAARAPRRQRPQPADGNAFGRGRGSVHL